MDMDVDSSGGEENDVQYDSHRLGYNPQVQDGGYDPQLENVRMESIRKIRGRFEHIYQKYGKDFEGVADEIDMTTGVIVVNNGHLQNMEHEVDAGNGDALALSRTFEDDEDDDGDEDDSSGSESEAHVNQDGGDDSNSVSSDNPELDFSWQDDTAASLTSPDEDGGAPSQPLTVRPSTPTDGAKRRKGKERTVSNAPAQDAAPEDLFGQMKDSMLALKDKYQNGQDMDPCDIQALGMSIANQLASFITGGKPSKKRKRQSAPNRIESVETSRGRPRTRSQSSMDPVAPTPARSPGSLSLWAPLDAPKGRRTSNKKKRESAAAAAAAAAEEAEEQAGNESLVDSIVLQTIMNQSALEPDELQGPTIVKCCSNCEATETLHWRRGPKAVDLCNNCGMYYYRYGVMRPLHTSPPPREKSTTPEPEYTDPRHKPAPYSANTSRPLDGVNLFGLHFSVREDAQLIKLKEIDRFTWDQIAMQHPGRTPYALQCRYSKHLHGKPCEARDVLSTRGYQFYIDSNGLTIAHQLGNFTEEEDDMLLKLREEDSLDWDGVALELPGRMAEDVEKRYEEMRAEYTGDTKAARSKAKSKPKPKSQSRKKRRDRSVSERPNGRYTPDEDGTILRMREDDNLSWQDIAEQMPGRTLASVQRHYSRDIGPYGRSRSSTPRGSPAPGEATPRLRKYTDEEDATLMQLRDEENLGWKQIAEKLPDRSASSLENRYYYKISKDDSRSSSRASSVVSSPRRLRRGSLPAADLEAQFDDAIDATPSVEDTFTEAEDNLIIKLRELECLSWDQIAAEMPGRDVSSISCRYYQYLLPRKVPEIRGKEQTLDPALQSAGLDVPTAASKAATGARPQDRKALVHELMMDTTADTADAPAAAPAKKGSNARKMKSDASPQRRSVAGRRSDAPMLRRALQKNLNRRSSRLAAPSELPDMSMMMDGANDDVIDDGDELSENHITLHQPTLLPSALPARHEVQPPASERKLRSSSKRKSMYPETPLRPSSGPYPSSGPTALDPALYFTPSRYQAQSHPYFLANAASPENGPVPVSNKRTRTERAAAEDQARSDESEEGIAFEGGKTPFRKRRRAPKPTRAACPRQVQTRDTDGEDDDLEASADDDAGEYFTSRKKKRGPSNAQKSFRGRKSFAADTRDDIETVEAPSRSRALSLDLEGETEEEDVEMPDLGTDDDDDSSASDEEEENDNELRCKPRERSPLFDPRETIEEAKHKKEVGPLRGKLSVAAKVGDGNTMDDFNTDIDVSDIPPEHLVRPDVSWTQLNFTALKSRAPEPMHTREIYAYLEEHFPFFRLCKGHWRDSIRGNLSTRPEFAKHSEAKAAPWCLADPNQEAIAVPKGEKRGRCPVGVVRIPKEEEGPKKKGRPSNASKGIPLKRAYKRNYVPAAERRRLAELGAEGAAALIDRDAGEADNAPGLDETAVPAATDNVTNAEAGVEAAASGAANSANARPARPSTIDDSDAGEQFESVDCLTDQPNDTDVAIKTEPQLPERTFAAPVANMIAPTSDIYREPKSTSDPPAGADAATASTDELSSEATPASISTSMHRPGLRSSSPALASAATSTRRLSRTYGKAPTINTPGTGRSTLFKQLAHNSASSAMKASPAFAKIARPSGASRSGTPGSLRRTVQTPMRETEGSEDELA